MKTEIPYMRTQALSVEVVQREGDKPTLYKARLFSEKPNRRGDVLVVAGMDTSAYEANPVVMLEHGYGATRLPIGRATGLNKGKSFIDASFEFDPDDPIAREVERKYNAGFMRAFSVGFNIHAAERIDPDDDSWFAPIRYSRTELLEFSVVAIPADTTAMRKQALSALRENNALTLANAWGGAIQIEV